MLRLLTIACILGWAVSGRAQTISCVFPDASRGQSEAVVVGPATMVYTTQLLPLDRRGNIIGKGQAGVQCEAILDQMVKVLAAGKAHFTRIVKLNVYMASPDVKTAVHLSCKEWFEDIGPAMSFVVTRLPHADALVAMDAVAVADPIDRVRFSKSSEGFSASAGAESAIMPIGSRVYISGQAEKGRDPVEATRKTLASLRATLQWLGITEDQVVQVKSFLTPMTSVADVTNAMVAHFGEGKTPPLVFVEWTSSLPIEIELVAFAPNAKQRSDEAIEFLTPPGMAASPVYCRVARVHSPETIFVSGLYAAPNRGAADQVDEVFGRLSKILAETKSDMRHLAKATYYVSDDGTSQKLNELRPRLYDGRRPPAASKAIVVGTGIRGCGITMDMIAVPVPKPPR
jgi:enamine deaminase RidA (YjgF/YER057c/UK114 family)